MKLLVGHALHNLAMLKAETDPGEAGRLLELSIAAKTRAKDEPGRVGVMFGRGSLAATEGQFDLALKWYSRAERLAAKWDMQHTRALALCNMGTAQGDVGNPRAALPHYQAAEELAAREGFPDALALAVGGAAKAYLALNRFAKAEERFRRLYEIHNEAGDAAAAVVALHDVGDCLLKQDKYGEARAVLTSAYVEAVDQKLSDWIYRCAKDIALTRLTSDGVDQAVSALRKAAEREAAEGRHEVSAGLWESVASVLAEHAPERSQIERSLLNALAETDRSGRPPEERFRLLGGLYQHRWDAGDVGAALEALRTGFQLATEQDNAEYRCRFADQLGMCLQQLGDTRVAIPHHRAAPRVARSLQQNELVENCLNNLGEALRKTGNAAEAIQLFLEAEAVARGRGDAGSEISVAHNRALAMQDAGQRAQAAVALRHCRDVSLRLECWDQFVRALHELANHAWMGSKTEVALGLYRQALAAAKKHHLPDQAVLISVNYANALLTRHRPRQAYTILLAVRSSIPAGPDALNYEFALGASAEEVGDFLTAAAAFETALAAASAAGDAEQVAQAATSLAECHMKAGHPIAPARFSMPRSPRRTRLGTKPHS